MLNRRRFCLGASLGFCCPALLGMGRLPYGGALSTAIPWALSGIDPHALNDPIAAFVGPALFEALFAVDSSNRVYPSLARQMPEVKADAVEVTLRSLYWSDARAVTAQDVTWSLERARRFGARGLFAGLGRFEVTGPRSFRVAGLSPETLARVLASPLSAVTSRAFHPARPVGCGPFRGAFVGGQLILTRNPYAARGAAFLERIEIRSAQNLGDALRQFEAGQCNLGWFGRGLHEPRPGSRMVDAGHAGWVVLHSGSQAGRWSRPGTMPSLIATLEPGALERFGLTRLPDPVAPTAYGGPDCDLMVRSDAPYLLELATTLASLLSRQNSRISARSVAPDELNALKQSRQFGFLIDQVRALGPTANEHQMSLLTEAGLSRNPARLPPNLPLAQVAAFTTNQLNLGVVGSLRLLLATIPETRDVERGSLADVWWAEPAPS